MEWEFWYTSASDTALDFIYNFQSYREGFDKSEVKFSPRIVSWSCKYCDADYKNSECLSDGKYCAGQHKETGYIRGREILFEDLRQKCIF